MKKFFIGLTILGGTIFLLIIIARLTNALQFYHGATSSMSPAIEPNQEFFSTNLAKPKHNDIIVFKRKTDMSDGDTEPGTMARFIYRLIAMSGEKLEIKNGIAYVNGQLADDSTTLKFYYTFDVLKTKDVLTALHLIKNEQLENEWIFNDPINTTALLTFSQYAIVQKITCIKKIDNLPSQDLYGSSITKGWTTHDYGPLIIPAGHYFLLGDNRDGAKDSRFIGPVNEESVTGVVIGIK